MKFQDILIWIMLVISLTITLWYLIGNSPSFEQTIIILVLTILIASVSELKEIKTKLSMLEHSFIRLADDFKEHIKHR